MPKLDTTIDNLERKSNMIKNGQPSSSWTDAQYPSAKTLYNTYSALMSSRYDGLLNIIHPVGSLMITSTNENPGKGTLGGTWELVDKSFRDDYLTLDTSDWTATAATLGNYSNIMLNDHMLSMRLNFKTTAALTDTAVDLGTLNPASCGINQFSQAIFHDVAISDGGNSTFSYRLDQNGKISVSEALNVAGTHNMASGSDFYLQIVQPVRHTDMLDEFCDKFYWKRIA